MRYSLIREMDISNGSGIGISLFVQGCHFHCKGCFNQNTWDFNGGKEWTPEIEKKFIELANKEYIKRISFLGGEPLAEENVETILYLIKTLKLKHPNKKIWLYTGYTWEHIMNSQSKIDLIRQSVLGLVDIVIDGQFQLSNQNINNKTTLWVGSTNQRVIDAKKSINLKTIYLWNDNCTRC